MGVAVLAEFCLCVTTNVGHSKGAMCHVQCAMCNVQCMLISCWRLIAQHGTASVTLRSIAGEGYDTTKATPAAQ